MSILILGGAGNLSLLGLGLADYLVSSVKPTYIRIADKHLCIPSSKLYLTFVPEQFKQILEKGSVDNVIEYTQVNIATEAGRKKSFDGHQFDYVFDFTGEEFTHTTQSIFLIEKHAKLARLLGEAAVAHNVKAYVKVCLGQFERVDGKGNGPLREDEPAAPWNNLSVWSHEACRNLADIPGLPLIVARPAYIYGPHLLNSFSGRLLIGESYKFRKERMEMLWSPESPMHTIHAADLYSALNALAQWIAEVGPKQALQEAGSPLSPCRPVPKGTHWSSSVDIGEFAQKDVDGIIGRNKTVQAALFYIVDDSKTTMKDIAQAVGSAVGVPVDFANSVINTFAKLNLSTVTTEVNEIHVESFARMLERSNPPISNPILTPVTPRELLSKHDVCLSNDKIKRLTLWRPKIMFDNKSVASVLESLRKETTIWPNAAPDA